MASSRFGQSSLHQRDARSALFDSYTGDRNSSSSRPNSGYGYQGGMGTGQAGGGGGYRPATPNSRGQYSDAVLSHLESQNDNELEGISGKVKMLKDLSIAIGDEIKSSSSLADAMNEGFEGTRNRLRGTMGRMLRMAERTGVPWKVWALFFLAVWALFAYVWLF